MIAQQSVTEVLNRAEITEIVGQFVRLKKRGANYIANCPFHNEKTPSFYVSAAKGIYKCFGCGKGGNVVTFIQDHERLSYPEAIRWLADFYKIELEETERSPEQKLQQQTEESLRLLNEYAATYFSDQLKTDEGLAIGMSYFRQRGFRPDIIEKFRLGYCPEGGDAFLRHALHSGYDAALMEKAGLVKQRNGSFYDAYRGRVIFPIQNLTGRVLGFGARILRTNEKAPKYVNSPENELYVKSRVLYGMYQSRQAIGKLDECLLVEGYTDVISLHQGGVENVVSSSGTSLTEDQLRLIGQLTRNLTILYDGDAAGIKAALRGLDMALSQSFNVQLVLLPQGEDPDSFVQKSGAASFHEYVKTHKQDVIGFRMEVGLKEAGNDPIRRSKLVNEVAESISRINKAEDFALQGHYIREASTRLQVDEAGLVNLVNKHIRERLEQERRQKRPAGPQEQDEMPEPDGYSGEEAPKAPELEKLKADDMQEWELIRVLVEHGAKEYPEQPNVATHIHHRIDPDLISHPLVRQVFDAFYEHWATQGALPELSFFTHYPDELVQKQMASLLQPKDDMSPNWKAVYGIETMHGDMNYVNEVDSMLTYFEVRKINQMKAELMQRLQTEQDPERLMRLQSKALQIAAQEAEIVRRMGTVLFKMPRH